MSPPSPEHPLYPRCLDEAVATAVDAFDEDTRFWFEERAAIIEYDGGAPRIEAERAALDQTRQWLEARQADQANQAGQGDSVR